MLAQEGLRARSASSSGRTNLLRWPARVPLQALIGRARDAWLYGTLGAAVGGTSYAAARVLRSLLPTRPATHPGTDAWRRLCDNPVVPPHEFESRFIAGPELATEGPWDFVVVGSGSAGCVVASRLSAYPGVRVLLIEAGGEGQNAAAVVEPRRAFELYRSEVDWGFRSEPQEHLLPKGRTINMERGLCLGGSSAINWLMWVHGQRQDFDRWAHQCGCGEEWSFDRVAPHFARLERVAEGFGGTAAPHRGDGGPVQPGTVFPQIPEVSAFLEACAANGVDAGGDYNSPGQEGGGPTQFSVQGPSGRRGDAFNSFIEPVLRTRRNLRVVSEAFVRRVVFDGARRATAVEVELNSGEVLSLRATREVVLAAGAVGSPHLLLLSGVGDQEELGRLGIRPVAHVPAVGRNLQDHPSVGVVGLAKESAPSLKASSGCQAVAFAHSPTDKAIAAEEGHERGPDCEFIQISRINPVSGARYVTEQLSNALLGRLGINTAHHPALWRLTAKVGVAVARLGPVQHKLGCLLGVAGELNHVESRGAVRLRSADPHVPPTINPNYCSDRRDVEKLKWFVLKMRDMMRHPSILSTLDTVNFPVLTEGKPAESLMDDSITDEQLEEYVRSGVGTTWHYSCTVRMGPEDDETCACNPRLHVKGVTGLRCVDASVMPFVNSANTNACCMAIGSVAADFIAEEHGLGATAVVPSRL